MSRWSRHTVRFVRRVSRGRLWDVDCLYKMKKWCFPYIKHRDPWARHHPNDIGMMFV